ncbi:LysR family transcriptional regulator [Paenibacillus sp. LMG 31460]|uniref:LysR family transcriptional regulator n=1 Tax=Paenibacillus germinis TaxID=2654979 RepID=A0ABX1YX43_9BACL|nr:LysR family transcriptional regulator [Paenibacillus germinis]NOU85557.1 LysR family transcriptional regulator [Paenibacillus germinis]
MDLKELTTFQTIIQEGNFTKAAVKLNYAQSTITNQVQRLERELGIQLFKRGWDAELTTSGQIFAAEIDKLIGHWNHVTAQAKALQREEIGSLHVGGLESMIEHVLPNSLRRFREHKPKVSCHFVNGNTDSLSRAVLQNQLDFAICGEPADPSSFRFEPLYNENISFIVANNHPLAERNGIIPFEELLNYPMIVGGNTCLYYLRLSKQYSHYTETPFLYTVSQISAIPGFVQRIPSVGAVLDSTALPPNVMKIHVELKDSSIPVGLLQLRNTEYTSSSKNLLMQYVKEELQRI